MENKTKANDFELLAKLWDQLTPTQQQYMLRRAELLAARNAFEKQNAESECATCSTFSE